MRNFLLVTTSVGALLVALVTASAQSRPASGAKTPAEILQENNAALALILSDGNSTVSLGSGFFIEGGAALVTNFHVIEGAKVVYVKTGDGRIFNTDTVYAFDLKQDLALLKVSPAAARTVALGDSEKVVIGTPITVIGNPEGLEKSVTNGLISGIRTIDGQQLFQISAPISPGSSGGPVFDEKGEVIGVVVGALSDGQNLNFAIPINLVSKVWAARREIRLAGLPVTDRAKEGTKTSASLDGPWAATFADSISSGQLSFTLVQDGPKIRGTYTSSSGVGGKVDGHVSNGKFSFELTQAGQGCPGFFTGSAELRSGSMVGRSGADCQGSHINGSFTMTQGLAPVAKALTPQQESALLRATVEPDSACHTATVLALNTTMRKNEIRTLRWEQIDFEKRILIVGKSKTEASTGRLITLNPPAFEALVRWAGRFPETKPEHYVFPWCESRHVDLTRPTKGWRTAWRNALKRAGFHCRFHDLRHTCITKLAESQASEQTIMSIAGHLSQKMLERYSHIRLAAKRAALDAIATPGFDVGVHQNVHQISAGDSRASAKSLN